MNKVVLLGDQAVVYTRGPRGDERTSIGVHDADTPAPRRYVIEHAMNPRRCAGVAQRLRGCHSVSTACARAAAK